MSRDIAEFAYDLHAGLSAIQVSEFDDLQQIGMAATLAIHIKGLGEIEYEVLRRVSDHFMSIPSIALREVLRILEEVGFVKLVEKGRKIERIIPNIPVFEDVYAGLDQYANTECDLNSHEQATLQILPHCSKRPRTRTDFSTGSALTSRYLIGASRSVRRAAYCPSIALSLVDATGEIGGVKLASTEIDLIHKLAEEGVIKPPTIKFGVKSESFLFTPRPGRTRLNAANREVYERAMALISAVRKDQLLATKFQIRSPLKILEALRDHGYLGSNTEAREQYANLVVLRVGYLKPAGIGWQLHLHKTPENNAALDLAIKLLRTGTLAGMEVHQEARIALTRGEEYIQSLISAAELKKRKKQIKDEQATHEFEQLLLKFD
jgi:hypothetical protein